MKAAGFLFAAIMAASCSIAFAKGSPKETVTIVDHESSTTPYDWEVDGRMSVSCYGYTCDGYYTAPRSGTQQIQGAILMLKRSDSSIVVAQCVSKINVMASLSVAIDAVNAGDPNSPTVYRDCREPDLGSIVEAEFRPNTVKLFWHYDGVHHVDSETYALIGYLKPSATVQPDSLPSAVAPKIEAFPSNRPALQPFTFPSDGFSAFFPAKPEIMKNNVSTPSGPLELHYYSAQDSGVKFIVMICDYGAQIIDPDAKLALVKTHFMTAGGFIDHEKKITLGQYPGILVEAEDKGGAFYTVHGYIVGSVLYEVRAIAATPESFGETADLLNSFQLIPRASY